MRLKCRGIISDYKDVFTKGEIYTGSKIKDGICEVYGGGRPKRDGTPWCGVLSLGNIVVLGVASFIILPEEDEDVESTGD